MFQITTKTFSGALPNRIKIGPIAYVVVETPDPKSEDGSGVIGLADYTQAMIVIDMNLAPVMKWQCLLHEIIHLIFAHIGAQQLPENTIDGISYTLLDFLIENGFLTLETL